MHYTLFVNVFRRNKINVIVHWIFDESGSFLDYLMSFKNGLILLRYSSIARVYLYHHYFCIQFNKLINCLLLHAEKVPKISNLITLFLIASFLLSLKRFLMPLIVVSYISFFIFYFFLLHLLCCLVFLSFSALELFIIVLHEKN